MRFDERRMYVLLQDGREISVPLWWYPRLLRAPPEQRRQLGDPALRRCAALARHRRGPGSPRLSDRRQGPGCYPSGPGVSIEPPILFARPGLSRFSNGGLAEASVGLISNVSSCRVHGSLRDRARARLNKASDARAAQCALRACPDSSWVRNRRSELALASSRQGPRSPIGEPLKIRSSRGGLRCPAEGGAVLPEPVQQGGELARERHFRLLGAAALGQPDGPGLEGRPTLDPGE